MVTKAVLSVKIQEDMNTRIEIGEEKFVQFVSERITTNEVNMLVPMKKFRLRIHFFWSSAGKKVIVNKLYKIVELKEDITLFAHVFLVPKARDIDLKQATGTYGISLVQGQFAAYCSRFHTASNSDLMSLAKDLPKDTQMPEEELRYETQADSICKRVAIIDGMVDLQSTYKPEWITNCSDLTKLSWNDKTGYRAI